LISHHLEWKVLIDVIDLFAIAANSQRPTPFDLAMPIQDVFGGNRMLFGGEVGDESI
jgi:hypothetical protein